MFKKLFIFFAIALTTFGEDSDFTHYELKWKDLPAKIQVGDFLDFEIIPSLGAHEVELRQNDEKFFDSWEMGARIFVKEDSGQVIPLKSGALLVPSLLIFDKKNQKKIGILDGFRIQIEDTGLQKGEKTPDSPFFEIPLPWQEVLIFGFLILICIVIFILFLRKFLKNRNKNKVIQKQKTHSEFWRELQERILEIEKNQENPRKKAYLVSFELRSTLELILKSPYRESDMETCFKMILQSSVHEKEKLKEIFEELFYQKYPKEDSSEERIKKTISKILDWIPK